MNAITQADRAPSAAESPSADKKSPAVKPGLKSLGEDA